jgi:hypothetical protein
VLRLGQPGVGVVFDRCIKHLDALVGEQPHHAVKGVGGQLCPFDGSGDVPHRHGSSFPALGHEVRHLVCERWPAA